MSEFKQQLTALFRNTSVNDVIYRFFWSGVDAKTAEYWWAEGELRDFLYELNNQGISFKHEDNHGGEGEGDDYWSVYSFTKDNETLYIQFQGWYQSYNGSEFTEWFFVEPKQVMVTQFVKVK